MKTRALIVVVGLAVALAGSGAATAHPGHGSCKVFGLGTADLAQGGIPPGAGPLTPDLVEHFHELECAAFKEPL